MRVFAFSRTAADKISTDIECRAVPLRHFIPSRHHLSYDDCLEDKRENYQNCSPLLMLAVLKDGCWLRFRFRFGALV